MAKQHLECSIGHRPHGARGTISLVMLVVDQRQDRMKPHSGREKQLPSLEFEFGTCFFYRKKSYLWVRVLVFELENTQHDKPNLSGAVLR